MSRISNVKTLDWSYLCATNFPSYIPSYPLLLIPKKETEHTGCLFLPFKKGQGSTMQTPHEVNELAKVVGALFETVEDQSWYAPLGHPFAVVLCSDGFTQAVNRNSSRAQALSSRLSSAIDNTARRIVQDGGSLGADIEAVKSRSLYKAACCVLGACMRQYDPNWANYHRCDRWKN